MTAATFNVHWNAVTGSIWISCDACGARHEVGIDEPTEIEAIEFVEPVGWEFDRDGDRCPECVAAHRQVRKPRGFVFTVTSEHVLPSPDSP